MPWLIQHKCNLSDTEVANYSMMAAKRTETGEDITRVMCPSCGEEFIMLGHDMFKEGHSTKGAGLSLPPGFVVARSRRS